MPEEMNVTLVLAVLWEGVRRQGPWNSLVAQWLRIRLPMQGIQV